MQAKRGRAWAKPDRQLNVARTIVVAGLAQDKSKEFYRAYHVRGWQNLSFKGCPAEVTATNACRLSLTSKTAGGTQWSYGPELKA
jgi:hypothetical protein